MQDGYFATHDVCSLLRKSGTLKTVDFPSIPAMNPVSAKHVSHVGRLPLHADHAPAALSPAVADEAERRPDGADEGDGEGRDERSDGAQREERDLQVSRQRHPAAAGRGGHAARTPGGRWAIGVTLI